MAHDIAIVGTGEKPNDPGRDGFAMAYRHARAVRQLDECELVACADIVPENARAFAEHFDLPDAAVYEDHERLLGERDIDVLVVCVPPRAHADVVESAIETDVPDAVHCEKPVATTWGDCQRMKAAADDRGVQLTFNHQLRYSTPFQRAKALLADGAIGQLRRIEFSSENLYDTGTHMFDACGYVTDQEPVDWILAGLDYTEENRWFGEHNENQAIAQWQYENGVYGVASVGRAADMIDAKFRLIGSEGALEVRTDGPPLQIRSGDGWEPVDTDGDGVYGPDPGIATAAIGKLLDALPVGDGDMVRTRNPLHRAMAAVVAGIESDQPPGIRAENALQATELIFAAWESTRRRGRVDLPLDVDDNPLASMVEDGQLPVAEETAPSATQS